MCLVTLDSLAVGRRERCWGVETSSCISSGEKEGGSFQHREAFRLLRRNQQNYSYGEHNFVWGTGGSLCASGAGSGGNSPAGAQQKQLRASKLRAVAAPTHKLEESGEYAEENYLHSSFPTTNRKGLRKHIASVFIPHKSRAMRERESERESERARARESLVHNGSFPMRCHSSPGVRSA
jgi:hypothetical protein